MAVLTAGLQNLRRQVDEAFPGRDRTTDGWIGDTAHQARTSGHNPDDAQGSAAAWNGDPDTTPEVRAWDMDVDLRDARAQVLVDHVRQLPGLAAVLRYMIFDHHEYHARNGFVPIPYTGDDPHTNHVHFEGAWTQAADQNTSFNYRLEAIPVALTADDKKWISDLISTVATRVWAAPLDIDTTAGVNKQAAGSVLAYTSSEHHRIEEKVDKVLAKP